MKNLRTHGKSTIVWLLLGLMVLGLGGYGVTSFSGGSTPIATVGDAEVTADDYARALRSEMDAISRQSGQALTMAQAQAMDLPRTVQSRLMAAAALEDQAGRIGLSVGDQQVAQAIMQAPAFTGPNGRFDRAAYGEVLRREGLNEAEFERQVRADESRMILQRAVGGGVTAPVAMTQATAAWLLETRDLAWRELTPEALEVPVADPDEETLKAWHQANAARFTAPETRQISYAWLTPDMLADEVELDEDALRALYESRIDQFQQPERRMISEVVFPSDAAASEARARLDAGQVDFAGLVAERGLTLGDVDKGEVTQADLGPLGEAVFAVEGPSVIGPVQTPLGPALVSVNAILSPVDVSFEQALPDLRAEAAPDRAARIIDDRAASFEELLASGATLEDLAEETPMQLGQIDFSASAQPDEGSIAGYAAFREQAAAVAEGDFPRLAQLDDGGVFALRLDQVKPAALIPYDQIAGLVAADWRAAETHRQLLALAEAQKLQATAAALPDGPATPEGQGDAAAASRPALHHAADLARDGWIDGVPADVIAAGFALRQPGQTDIVDAGGRVFLVTLEAIKAADLDSDEAQAVAQATGTRLGQSLQSDIFGYYVRALQNNAKISLNTQVINAVNAQLP